MHMMTHNQADNMTSAEMNVLTREDFRRRISNYTHKDIIERIVEAWNDSDSDTFPENQDFSDAFVIECERVSEQE